MVWRRENGANNGAKEGKHRDFPRDREETSVAGLVGLCRKGVGDQVW